MLYMCSPEVKSRLLPVLEEFKLPINADVEFGKISNAIIHDKKAAGDKITTVFVDKIGSYRFVTEEMSEFLSNLEGKWKK